MLILNEYIIFSFQVREMVEIITREFIQMASTAGEVDYIFIDDFKLRAEHFFFFLNKKNNAFLVDGAGKSKDSAEIYADDEFGV